MIRGRKPFRYRKHKQRDFQSPEYLKWKKAVYKRDDNTCQMPNCKYSGKYKEVHHIIKWADNPALRYNVNNGITLCKACHKSINSLEYFFAPLFIKIIADKNVAQSKPYRKSTSELPPNSEPNSETGN